MRSYACSKRSIAVLGVSLFVAGGALAAALVPVEYKSGKVWKEPALVTPGVDGGAPSDAIVLFDGKSMAAWDNGESWTIHDDGSVTVGGNVTTKQAFGDCQLHVEWAAPAEVSGDGQGRGNSGVYLMGNYEVQVLDSYGNETYFDGQAASVYKQQPPLVNACRKPGEWQTYDIVFTAPRFSKSGEVEKPAFVTVLHNGVLVQNHFQIEGTSAWDAPPKYTAHADKLPLSIQYHRNPVKFRNIWIREIGGPQNGKG